MNTEIKSIKIDAYLHKLVKIKASEEGKTVTNWVEEAIKNKLGPSKEEKILDAMAVNHFLRDVYKSIDINGIGRSKLVKKLEHIYQKTRHGNIDQALDKLCELGAIKAIPTGNLSTPGDKIIYRKLVELKLEEE
jgi:hypothetical protein